MAKRIFAWICFSMVAWTFLIMPLTHRHASGNFQGGGEIHFPGGVNYTHGEFEHPNNVFLSPDIENLCNFCEFLFSVQCTLHSDIILQRTVEFFHFHIGIPSGIFDAAFSSLFNKGSPF